MFDRIIAECFAFTLICLFSLGLGEILARALVRILETKE